MKKRVLLIGGFHKAISLSKSLLSKGYKVTVINNDYQNCLALAEIEDLNVIQGDGTKPYILEDGDAFDMDLAIALTQRDDDNLVICELCKKQFHVKKTVSLVSDPKKMEFFYKMGIDSVVCAINVITNYIEQQAFMDEFATLIPIAKSNVSMFEITILPKYPAVGMTLNNLQFPIGVIVGCIIRGEQSMIPNGETTILAGDSLVLITSPKNQKEAIRVLSGSVSK